MGYETNIENAIKAWLTNNTGVISEAVVSGAARAVAEQTPDAVMRLGTCVAVMIEKWLENNKTAIIDAIAGQIATFNQQRFGGGDIDIQQMAEEEDRTAEAAGEV